MSKYTFEFKKKVVEEYINGKGGYRYLRKKYNLPSIGNLCRWVQAYQDMGEKGLMPAEKNKKYSFEFKLNVVNLYITSNISYQDLALSSGIKHPSIVSKWVNDYRRYGVESLKPKQRGRRPKMPKGNKEPINKSNSVVKDTEYLKKLEDENLRLRIENAFLKEKRRLRLQEEAEMNRRREQYTASEENSD